MIFGELCINGSNPGNDHLKYCNFGCYVEHYDCLGMEADPAGVSDITIVYIPCPPGGEGT